MPDLPMLTRTADPSDLTDEQWALIEVVNAILYVTRTEEPVNADETEHS
ncbi:transposase [Corallococcus terminator]|nr:transposase [Corallococcus terminator]